jgi:hypothetical protein
MRGEITCGNEKSEISQPNKMHRPMVWERTTEKEQQILSKLGTEEALEGWPGAD